MKLAALLIVVLGLGGNLAPAQMPQTMVTSGISARLYSDVLKEERGVLIALPRTYATTTQRYPVLFLLDGDTHFQYAAAGAEFLSSLDRTPELIVVGIPNNARLRDLSPPTDLPEEVELGTGGDAFVDFIVRELAPWLEANYRAAPLRILFGHSRGGLINLHALLTRPEAFRAHIVASPYFGWSRDRMILRAQAEIGRLCGRHYLYVSAGDSEVEIRDSVLKLVKVLERKAPPGLLWKYQPLHGEDHGSTPYLTLYNGLRGFFAHWTPSRLIEAGDIAGLDAHYAALSLEYGYEIVPSAVALDGAGQALLEKGRKEAAVAVFERNTRLYPKNRYAFESLSMGLKAMGRGQDARRALETAFELARSTGDAEDRKFFERDRQELESLAQ